MAVAASIPPKRWIETLRCDSTGRGAAAVAMVDATEGVLRPGARADWVVLNGDPLSCRASELADLRVVATAIGGDIVHQTAQ